MLLVWFVVILKKAFSIWMLMRKAGFFYFWRRSSDVRPSFAKEIQTEYQSLSDTWHSPALICFDKRFSFVIQGNYICRTEWFWLCQIIRKQQKSTHCRRISDNTVNFKDCHLPLTIVLATPQAWAIEWITVIGGETNSCWQILLQVQEHREGFQLSH